MKRLKYSNIQLQPGPPGARALLTVKFMDDGGEVYSWMPRWSEAEQLFLRAINIESFNKPESEWLPRFAKTVKETAESVNQPIQSAYKVTGELSSIHDGKLVIREYQGQWSFEEHSITPLFPLSLGFLDAWLGRIQVEAFVVNDVCVQLRDLSTRLVYPLSQELEGNGVDDLRR